MDIQNIIKDLIDSGLTESNIADMVGGVSQPTINRIKSGEIKETKLRIGLALMEIHKKVCRRKSRSKQ
jgi:predicted transcriptional regulator